MAIRGHSGVQTQRMAHQGFRTCKEDNWALAQAASLRQ